MNNARQISFTQFGGRMTKWKGRAASIAPGLAAVSVVALSASGALSETISTSQSTVFSTTVDEDHEISAGATIDVTGGTGPAVADVTVDPYTGTFTFDGAIIGTDWSDRFFAGLGFTGQFAGTLTGAGTVDITQSVGSGIKLTGIAFDGIDASGVVDISGDVNVTMSSAASHAGTGIYFGSYVDGTVNSSGNITVTSTNPSDHNTQYGINAGTLGGSMTISGDTTVIATGGSSDNTAIGIDINTVTGTFANSGNITATASVATGSGSSAEAIGIDLGNLSGTATNSGTIDVTAEAGGFGDATGAYISTLSGSFENSGDITALLSATGYGSAVGIGFFRLFGELINSGNLTVTAQSSGSSATGHGINLYSLGNGATINNSGDITVSVTAPGEADAYGIYSIFNEGGSITNSGAISLTAQGYSKTGTAQAFTIASIASGQSLNNSGDISITLESSAAGMGSANGIGFSISSVSGTFENSGDIAITATDNGMMTSHDLVGLNINLSGADAVASNSGNISITSDGSDFVTALGMSFLGLLPNDLSNTGHVDIQISEHRSSVNATGIFLGTPDTGVSVSNSGNVSIDISSAASATGSASAFGLVGIPSNGMMTNTGDVSITLTDNSGAMGNLFGTGVFMPIVSSQGTATNSGNVDIAIQGADFASASGVTNVIIFGTSSNSGNINLSISDVRMGAYASGLSMGLVGLGASMMNTGDVAVDVSGGFSSASTIGMGIGDNSGTVTNSGDVTVSASGGTNTTNLQVRGIFATDITSDGSTTNSGDVTITAASGNSGSNVDVTFAGIRVGDVSGSYSNSGAISVTGSSGGQAWIYGQYANSVDSTASFDNTGQITVSGTNTNTTAGNLTVVGLDVRNVMAGATVNNSGDITVSASGGQTNHAAGIYSDMIGAGATLNSDGQIITMASGSAGAGLRSIGIDIGAMDGTLNVNGDIWSTGGTTDNYAISLGSGSGTLNIDALVDGTIAVTDHDVSLNHTGASFAYVFEDGAVGSGTFDLLGADGVNTAWVSQDDGTATPTYIAVTGSDYAMETQSTFQLASLTDLLDGVFEEIPEAGAPNTRAKLTYGRDGGAAAPHTFARVGTIFDFDDETDTTLFHVTAGLVFAPEASRSFGIAAHVIDQNQQGTGESLSSEGVMITGLAEMSVGRTTLSFGGGAGALNNVSERSDAGGGTLTGRYDSTIYYANAGFEHPFETAGAADLILYGDGMIGRLETAEYTETGSAAAATVAARTIDFGELRLGGRVEVDALGGTLSAGLGALYRDVSAPSTVAVSVAGTPLNLASGDGGSETLGEVTVGYSVYGENGGHVRLTASSEFGGSSARNSVGLLLEQKF